MRGRKGTLIACGGLLLALVFVLRVGWVNAHAYPMPEVVHHAMGEWVELDGAFVEERNAESTEGYAVRVTGAERLSYNEYLERYGVKGTEPLAGLTEPSLVCVTLEIRNTNSETGGLQLESMHLVPERKNEFFRADMALLAETEEGLSADGLLFGVAIRPGTEYVVAVPYVHQDGTTQYEGRTISAAYLRPIADTRFELVLTKLPVRHVIDIEL